MPLHNINGTPVFIHELQSVMLISASEDSVIDKDAVQAIVNQVVADHSQYHIQEPDLNLDVFVRQGDVLLQYSFTGKGEFILDTPSRSLEDDGLLHFQFSFSDGPIGAFRLDDAEYKITRVTTAKFNALSASEQDKMLDEIAAFNLANFPEHFELWDLNDKSPELIREHFRHLQSSLSSLYVIRDNEDKIVAINGISATPDGQLTFQSMTVTRIADRGKGFMAVDLGRATFDYPDAIMTAYCVNSDIRHALGQEALTYSNRENFLPEERSHYLEEKLASIEPIAWVNPAIERQIAIKLQIQAWKREYDARHVQEHKVSEAGQSIGSNLDSTP